MKITGLYWALAAALAFSNPAHADTTVYDADDPLTWPGPAGVEPEHSPPSFACNAHEGGECNQAYRHACQNQGKQAACDVYNDLYARDGETISLGDKFSPESLAEADQVRQQQSAVSAEQLQQRLQAIKQQVAAAGNGGQPQFDTTTQEGRAQHLQALQQQLQAMQEPGAVQFDTSTEEGRTRQLQTLQQQLRNLVQETGIQPLTTVTVTLKADGSPSGLEDSPEYQRMLGQMNAYAEKSSKQHGDEDSVCGIILCLTNSSNGGSMPNQCKKHIRKFFGIVKTKHGKFSASRTAQARDKKLQECKAGDTERKRTIAKFGGLPHAPAFAYY